MQLQSIITGTHFYEMDSGRLKKLVTRKSEVLYGLLKWVQRVRMWVSPANTHHRAILVEGGLSHQVEKNFYDVSQPLFVVPTVLPRWRMYKVALGAGMEATQWLSKIDFALISDGLAFSVANCATTQQQRPPWLYQMTPLRDCLATGGILVILDLFHQGRRRNLSPSKYILCTDKPSFSIVSLRVPPLMDLQNVLFTASTKM